MKRLSLLLPILLITACSPEQAMRMAAGQPTFTVEYDRIADNTTYKVSPIVLEARENRSPSVALMAIGVCEGEGCRPMNVAVGFLSHSNDWEFLRSNHVYIVTPDDRYEDAEPIRDGDVSSSRYSTMVQETVISSMTAPRFIGLVDDEGWEIRVGSHDYVLSAGQMGPLREMAAALDK